MCVLAQYHIPETLVQPDFNTNNMLFDPVSKKMTLTDLGEIAITHPFFSLHNFPLQATIHHGVKEQDQLYQQLQRTCFEKWLARRGGDKKRTSSSFYLKKKKLWPIYGALAYYRLMMSVDLKALKSFLATNKNPIDFLFILENILLPFEYTPHLFTT